MLGQPHMLDVLHAFDVSNGHPLRFTELQNRLRLSPKTLSQRLRTLVDGGFLTRTAYGQIPPRVEYAVTRKTEDLGGVFDVLKEWARRNTLTVTPSLSRTGPARS